MDKSLIELAKKFWELSDLYDIANATLKKVTDEWNENEAALIEAMITFGVPAITIEGRKPLKLKNEAYPSVNNDNKPKFFEYLKSHGHGGLLKLDVHTGTLNSFLKTHLLDIELRLVDDGPTEEECAWLSELPEPPNVSPGTPVDEMDAQELAKTILATQGAATFMKKKIRFK